MDLAFPWPASYGERLAFLSAAITAIYGLIWLFAPAFILRLTRLMPQPLHPEATGNMRAHAGFYIGTGLCCIITGQFWIYLALGFSWAFTAFGRIVAMMSDRGPVLYNIPLLVLEAVMALLPLLYATGLVP